MLLGVVDLGALEEVAELEDFADAFVDAGVKFATLGPLELLESS